MKRNGIRLAPAVLLAAVLLALPLRADTIGGAEVHTDDTGLNLRAGAATDTAVLAEVPDGSFLLVEEKLDGWYRVVYQGLRGYVSGDYVSFSETLDGVYDFGAATKGTDVNLRAGATTASGVVKRFSATGTELTVTGVAGNWLRVRDAVGSEGFIRSDLVTYWTDAPAAEPALPGRLVLSAAEGAPPAVEETVGAQIAATAREYLGCSYRWGGMSPETGFDCSGFANYIYNLYGYSLERVAQNIYSTNGTSVGWDELQPGDLLFFGWGAGSVTHVGIYVGDGQMVHASTSTTGVILTELDGTRYPQTFVGAKRIVG